MLLLGEKHGGDLSSQRHTNLSVATSGVCNKSKEISTRTTTKNKKFLGLIIDSQNLSLSLTEQKLQKVKNCCVEMYNVTKVSILELTKLLGLLCSTVQAVLPAQLQIRYLQQLQIRMLQQERCYYQQITLNQKSKQELTWWIQNLSLCNGRCLVQPQPQMIIQTDAGTGEKTPYQYIRTVSSEISPFEFYK